MSAGKIVSGSRRHSAVCVRASVCWIADTELGDDGAEVMRGTAVTDSFGSHIASSGKRPDIEDLIMNL